MFLLAQLRFGGGVEGNLLLLELERVSGGASEYHLPPPPHRVPSPATSPPAEPTSAPWQPPVPARVLQARPDIASMRMGRPFTLFTTQPIDLCAQRIGPSTCDAEFPVEWIAANEVVFARPVLRPLRFRYELRAELHATTEGTFTVAFGWWVAGAVKVLARQVLTAGLVDDLVTTFEDLLAAVPAVPDAGRV